jgi:uncharacterized protein DUF3850
MAAVSSQPTSRIHSRVPRSGSAGSPETVEHTLKSWPQFFELVLSGEKTHDLRRNDRDFRVGDLLRLQEFDVDGRGYTGRQLTVTITYITSADYPCALSSGALHPDFCILSIRKV